MALKQWSAGFLLNLRTDKQSTALPVRKTRAMPEVIHWIGKIRWPTLSTKPMTSPNNPSSEPLPTPCNNFTTKKKPLKTSGLIFWPYYSPYKRKNLVTAKTARGLMYQWLQSTILELISPPKSPSWATHFASRCYKRHIWWRWRDLNSLFLVKFYLWAIKINNLHYITQDN